MRSLEQESSVEVLRAFAIYAMNEAKRARAELAAERLKKFKAEQLKLKFEEQLLMLRGLIFGSGTKNRGAERPRDRDKNGEGDNALLHSQSLLAPIKDNQLKMMLWYGKRSTTP